VNIPDLKNRLQRRIDMIMETAKNFLKWVPRRIT
jgi:hypothetical protein